MSRDIILKVESDIYDFDILEFDYKHNDRAFYQIKYLFSDDNIDFDDGEVKIKIDNTVFENYKDRLKNYSFSEEIDNLSQVIFDNEVFVKSGELFLTIS